MQSVYLQVKKGEKGRRDEEEGQVHKKNKKPHIRIYQRRALGKNSRPAKAGSDLSSKGKETYCRRREGGVLDGREEKEGTNGAKEISNKH